MRALDEALDDDVEANDGDEEEDDVPQPSFDNVMHSTPQDVFSLPLGWRHMERRMSRQQTESSFFS